MTKKYDLQRVIKIINWLIFEKIVNTRRELAEKLDYTESSFSQILNGKVPIAEKFIKKLSNFDDRINPDWFLSDNAPMLKHAKNPFSQMTEAKMEDRLEKKIAEELMILLKDGEIYLAAVHDRIVAEKNEEIVKRGKQIEDLQRRVWELEKQLEDIKKEL